MQAEHNRQIANLIKQGTVAECDPVTCRVRVQHGGLTTDWLPYCVPAAGGVSVHRPPSVGENCLLLSPSGETANGVVLCGLASSQYPSPSGSPDETVMVCPDGARFEYNHASGHLNISGIKTVVIQAAQSMVFDTPQATFTGMATVQGLFTYQAGMSGSNGAGGTTRIEGDMQHIGKLENSGAVISNGVDLSGHDHNDLTSGGKTGKANAS